MTLPEVTVVIPTYNRAWSLPRAIDSVLEQTVPAKDIIIVDDGSTDHTAEQLKNYGKKIRTLTQAQQGVSAARNTGIKNSNTDWIAFLDSDDAWHPKKLAEQIKRAIEEDRQIVHTNEVWLKNNVFINQKKIHKKQGGWIFQQCLPLCAISPSSVLIHRCILDTCGYFDESLPACEDYDLWLRITCRYPVAFCTQALTIKHGGHDDQLSQRFAAMDRFRILALSRLLDSNVLNQQQRLHTLNTLEKKLKIYINGARKRKKYTEVQPYLAIKNKYQAEFSG